MLSVIICSVNERLLSDIKKNIASTIGIEYELLVWNNKRKGYGLCGVYNLMAAKAQYSYMCFLHEDIIFQTNDWGKIAIEILNQQENIGLVGVAGGQYKGRYLSGWFSGIAEMDRYHILHKSGQRIETLSNSKDWPTPESRVVCIDGVFMCVKKVVWAKFKFNEQLLKGFHFYDLDFSLRVSKLYNVVVTTRIEIVHLTRGGDFGDKWVGEAFLFHSEHSKDLPRSLKEVNIASSEFIIAKTWLDRLKTEDISIDNKIKWIKSQQLYKHKMLWWSILKFLIYKPLGGISVHNFFKKLK
jgi:hypothetical protein